MLLKAGEDTWTVSDEVAHKQQTEANQNPKWIWTIINLHTFFKQRVFWVDFQPGVWGWNQLRAL